MTIESSCECGNRYHFKDELAGKRVRCPSCQRVIVVPQAAPTDLLAKAIEQDTMAAEQKSERPCQSCGKPVSSRDALCPHCGVLLQGTTGAPNPSASGAGPGRAGARRKPQRRYGMIDTSQVFKRLLQGAVVVLIGLGLYYAIQHFQADSQDGRDASLGDRQPGGLGDSRDGRDTNDGGEDPRDGVRPVGFAVLRKLPAGRDIITGRLQYILLKDSNKRFIVIVAFVPSDLVMPSEAEYTKLKGDHDGRTNKLYPPRNCLSHLDSARFRIVLADGQAQRQCLVADLRGSAGSLGTYFSGGTMTNTRYSKGSPEPLKSPTKIGVACVAAREDCKPPFKLQIDQDDPVDVPNKKVGLPR